jgi:hypothetical protein
LQSFRLQSSCLFWVPILKIWRRRKTFISPQVGFQRVRARECVLARTLRSLDLFGMEYRHSSVSTDSNLTTIASMADPDPQVAGGAIRSQLVHQEGQVEEDHYNPRYGGAAMSSLSFSGSQPAGRDFVGGSRFGQPSSDTYGGINGGQMVMGSAMGAGGAQFGGGGFGGVGDFVGPGGGFQPAGGGFGSQTTGGGFGGGGPSPILDPSRPLPARFWIPAGGFGGVGDFVGPGGGFQPAGGEFGSQTTGGGLGGGGFGQSQPDFGSQPAAAQLLCENQAVVPSPLPPAGGPFQRVRARKCVVARTLRKHI